MIKLLCLPETFCKSLSYQNLTTKHFIAKSGSCSSYLIGKLAVCLSSATSGLDGTLSILKRKTRKELKKCGKLHKRSLLLPENLEFLLSDLKLSVIGLNLAQDL